MTGPARWSGDLQAANRQTGLRGDRPGISRTVTRALYSAASTSSGRVRVRMVPQDADLAWACDCCHAELERLVKAGVLEHPEIGAGATVVVASPGCSSVHDHAIARAQIAPFPGGVGRAVMRQWPVSLAFRSQRSQVRILPRVLKKGPFKRAFCVAMPAGQFDDVAPFAHISPTRSRDQAPCGPDRTRQRDGFGAPRPLELTRVVLPDDVRRVPRQAPQRRPDNPGVNLERDVCRAARCTASPTPPRRPSWPG